MCGMQQATSSIRQHTQHTALVSIRQHTSLWVFDVLHAIGVTNYKSECKESCRRWCALSLRRRRMPTYAGVCWHMLAYTDVCCMLQAGDGARCVFAAGWLGPQGAGQRYAHALYWWWSRLRSPAVLHTYVHKHSTHARAP
jgi:hypothetical protein